MNRYQLKPDSQDSSRGGEGEMVRIRVHGGRHKMKYNTCHFVDNDIPFPLPATISPALPLNVSKVPPN